ncbi:MAG: acyltransferase family protein [Rhodobacter sp.]|nr:acyltransferase family protein [Rhodobacter sp.]
MAERLVYVEWLRVFLICSVVAHHAAQPYGPTGGAWPVDDPVSSDLLRPFFIVNAAYFMGFFFLISGYFLAASYDRKGGAAFVTSRLIRLGVPLVVFGVIVNGVVGWAIYGAGKEFVAFFVWEYVLGRTVEWGPLWFILHLLIYALLYAAWRGLGGPDVPRLPPPGHRTVLGYILMLGAVTFLVRQAYPIDVWIRIFGVVPVELAHLPQYLSLFVIGIAAGRGGWFTEIGPSLGLVWFPIGLVVFTCAVLLNAQAAQLSAWVDLRALWGVLEGFVCVGMILGLLTLFRRMLAAPGPWISALQGQVYGVYLIHVYVVVGLHFAFLAVGWQALTKFGVVTVLSIVLSFTLVAALQRIPVVRAVM